VPDRRLRGPITILLTDVDGSTALYSTRGDSETQAILRTCEELARREVRTHTGRAIKSFGGGLMASFASPRQAVACAQAIQGAITEHGHLHPDQQVKLRVGLHTGEASMVRGDLYGVAVSAAARICARARGGEVLASEVVRQLCGASTEAVFQERGRVALKGLPERWRLYQVTSPSPPAPQVRRVAGATPFVGREAERRALESLLDGAAAGQGGLVMIGGEPGVGKTRLCREIAAEGHRRRFMAFTGHCYRSEGDLPYMPWVEIVEAAIRQAPRARLRDTLGDCAPEIARIVPELRHLFPDIPPPVDLPAEHQRRYTFGSISEYIARVGARRPQLYVLEDLHWADEATLLLLEHLAERLRTSPVLIVGTYRDSPVEEFAGLAETLSSLVRNRRAHLIGLGRHSQPEVAAMLRAMSGQAPPDAVTAAIYVETEGNAFFVEEVFHHLAETGRLVDERGRFRAGLRIADAGLPQTIRLVVGQRLERLSDATRRALSAAAVIGPVADLELLEALVGGGADTVVAAVEEAERAGLMTSSTDECRVSLSFAHELVRQALQSRLSLPRRQRLHLHIAEAMERIAGAGAEDQAAAIAHHLVQAGPLATDRNRTVRHLAIAARRALDAATFETALRQLETALELLGPGDEQLRADLLVALGTAQQGMGLWDDSIRSWSAALDIHELRGDVEAAARLCRDMSMELSWGGKFTDSVLLASRGLSLAGERPSAARAILLAISGMAYGYSGNADGGDSLTAQAIELAEGLPDARSLGFALHNRAYFHFYWSDPGRCVEVGRRGVEQLSGTGDLFNMVGLQSVVQFALLFCGRIAESRALDAEVASLGVKLGHHGAELMHHHFRACSAIMAGDLEGLQRAATDDLQVCRSHGLPWTPDAHVLLGLGSFWRGDWERALAHFEDGMRETVIPGAFDAAPPAFRLLALAHLGDTERTLEAVARLQAALPAPGRPLSLGGLAVCCVLVQVLTMLGRRQEAALLHPRITNRIAAGVAVDSWDLALLHDVAGVAAAAADRWRDAELHFDTALRQADELPHRLAAAETRRHYAAMLTDRRGPGDANLARSLATEAMNRFASMRMPRHRRMAKGIVAML